MRYILMVYKLNDDERKNSGQQKTSLLFAEIIPPATNSLTDLPSFMQCSNDFQSYVLLKR